jgi:pilus assembly protein CpaB
VFLYATLFMEKKQVRSSWQLSQVVVAAEDLNVGDAITVENVAIRAIPNVLDSINVVKGDALEQILNQRVTVVVQTGDPLFFSQFLSTKLANERLSRRVLKHGRGFTISTSVISSVGQMVTPGDLVDVLVSFPMPGEQGERRAVTLMQKVHVLATGKILDTSSSVVMKNEQNFGDVTLLLTAEEAEVLTLAAQLGHVVLTLRAEEDYDDDRPAGSYTSSDTLLSGERQRLLKEKRANMIQLIRGMPSEPKKK